MDEQITPTSLRVIMNKALKTEGLGFTVLVTDDSKLGRDAAKKAIVEAGLHKVAFVEASNGERALEVLRSEKVDLLLLDIHMPIMNGDRVLDAMAADADLRQIPTFIVSTEGSWAKSASWEPMETVAFVKKPVTSDTFKTLF